MSLFGVIGLYNLLLFFVVRRKIYLQYCLMVLGFFGHVSNYWLRADFPSFSGSLSVVTASLAMMGSLIFSKTFLQLTQRKYPRWTRIYLALIWTTGSVIVVQSCNMAIGPSALLQNLLSLIAASCALITIVVQLWSSFYLWKKERTAKLYFYTFLPIFFGAAVYTLRWFSASEGDGTLDIFDPAVAIMFGSVLLQMVLFSVVVGYTLKDLEDEKFQLQRDYASELEAEVQAQTRSLTRARDQIEQQRSDLLATNKFKNKLFSLIAHDLRNPLTSLLGLVDMLGSGDLSKKEIDDFVHYQQDRIKKLISTLDRVLRWSYAQLEGIQVRKKKVNLEEVVTENIALASEKIEAKHLKLQTAFTVVNILADRDMIDAVVRNLLGNAIKFSQEGGIIRVSTLLSGDRVELSIQDHGIGMDASWLSDLGKSEDMHVREGTAGEKGKGFGLLICRDFVQMNDGILKCESTIGEGTTFSVTLPQAAD